MILGHLFVLFFGGGGQLKEIKFNIKKFTSKKFILPIIFLLKLLVKIVLAYESDLQYNHQLSEK